MKVRLIKRWNVFVLAGFVWYLATVAWKILELGDLVFSAMMMVLAAYVVIFTTVAYGNARVHKWMNGHFLFGGRKDVLTELSTPGVSIILVSTRSQLPVQGEVGRFYHVIDSNNFYRYLGESGYQLVAPASMLHPPS